MLDILDKLSPENSFRNWYFQRLDNCLVLEENQGRGMISGCSQDITGLALSCKLQVMVYSGLVPESGTVPVKHNLSSWKKTLSKEGLHMPLGCTISKLQKDGFNAKLCFHHCVLILGILNLLNFPKSPRCSCCYCLCPFRCGYILLKLPVLHMISTSVLLTTINFFLLRIQLRELLLLQPTLT